MLSIKSALTIDNVYKYRECDETKKHFYEPYRILLERLTMWVNSIPTSFLFAATFRGASQWYRIAQRFIGRHQ